MRRAAKIYAAREKVKVNAKAKAKGIFFVENYKQIFCKLQRHEDGRQLPILAGGLIRLNRQKATAAWEGEAAGTDVNGPGFNCQ